MQFTITGRVPSKKNQKIMSCRGSRPMLFPSKNYKEWHAQAALQLMGKWHEPPLRNCSMIIEFFPPDKIRADMTNKAESLIDLLVDMKILEDDSWFILGQLILKMGGVDRENPRAEITLNYEQQ